MNLNIKEESFKLSNKILSLFSNPEHSHKRLC